ncbi:hypothetical protein D3C79_812990 [compost metagenome]
MVGQPTEVGLTIKVDVRDHWGLVASGEQFPIIDRHGIKRRLADTLTQTKHVIRTWDQFGLRVGFHEEPVEVAVDVVRDNFSVADFVDQTFTHDDFDEDLFAFRQRFFTSNAVALEPLPSFIDVKRRVNNKDEETPDRDVGVLFHDRPQR